MARGILLEAPGRDARGTARHEAPQGADGIGVRVGFTRALGGGPITEEHERAHHLTAPLDGVDKSQT